MIVTVNSQLLAVELRLLNRVVPTKPAIAILSYALLRADEGLHLYATDLEVGLSTDCSAQVSMPGAAALPVAKLLSLVEQFPDGDVVIKAEKSQVTVQCGAFKSRLQAMPVDDFPRPPQPEGPACTLNGDAFRKLIARARYAVNDAGGKYILKGALLTLRENVGAMAATDGKRLALSTMHRSGSHDVRTVIPAKAMDAVAGSDGDVELTVTPRHLFFASGGRLLVSRTIDGEFPKYEKIIPLSNDKLVNVDRQALASALRRVNLVAEDNRAVYFNLSEDLLELSSSSAEVGSASEPVRVNYDGTPLKVCINGAFVLDFLNAASGQTIVMKLNDANSPALLTDGDDHVGVIMLMKA